jgi:hypothetical protein
MRPLVEMAKYDSSIAGTSLASDFGASESMEQFGISSLLPQESVEVLTNRGNDLFDRGKSQL